MKKAHSVAANAFAAIEYVGSVRADRPSAVTAEFETFSFLVRLLVIGS